MIFMQIIQQFLPNIFQFEALKEIDKAMFNGENKALIIMPTGTGKTYLASMWFKKQLEKNPKTSLLFVCHNKDILKQANDKEFSHCLAQFNIPSGYFNADEKNLGQVTFATTQTLVKHMNKISSDYFMKKVKKQAEPVKKVEEKKEEVKVESQPAPEKAVEKK